jgi:small redox-active disulfide protein 2
MNIQVLGSGCATCKKLCELTQEAVKQLNLDEKVEYITDVSKIIEMGVMSSPVLAINGKPVMVGIVPDIEKIKKLITSVNDSTVSTVGCDCMVDEDCCDDCDCKKDKASCSCGGKC